MTRPFRPYNPDQTLLLPPSLRDWVPEGDLSHFISDAVEVLDLSKFYERYRDDGTGCVPYEPRMMVKVLVYAYCVGVFSSRKIAQRIERDVSFRMLAADNYPDHRTLNTFRLENLENFEGLFVQVVQMAQEAGLVKLGTIGIDGSKVKANASKRKAMSYGRMKKEEERLKREIHGLSKRAQQEDTSEDELYGEEFRGDELPEELQRRESRVQKIQEAKARLEARQREEDRKSGRKPGDHKPENRKGRKGKNLKREFGVPEDKKQDNFTDPESRIMKTSTQGFQQCYNAQVAVDEEERLIVATDVCDNPADAGSLEPVLDEVKENTGVDPKNVLADAGYKSEENFKKLKARKVRGYIPLGREGKEGKKIDPDLKLTRAMKRRLEGKRGKEIYRKRKWIAEPPFGWIKHVMGFQGFSMRGLEKAKGEWNIVCMAVNLKRLNGKIAWNPI